MSQLNKNRRRAKIKLQRRRDGRSRSEPVAGALADGTTAPDTGVQSGHADHAARVGEHGAGDHGAGDQRNAPADGKVHDAEAGSAHGADASSQNARRRAVRLRVRIGQPSLIAPPAIAGQRWSDAIVLLPAGIAEVVLAVGAATRNVPVHWALLGHVMVVLALFGQIYLSGRDGNDVSHKLLGALAICATGPLGAIGALVVALLRPREEESAQLLEDWYERISHSTEVDEVTQFCDMVAIGRAIDLGGPPPSSFASVMDEGSLREKQNALGLVARNFHLDYLPALRAALKSDLPVIRVQAAAVAAHVRDPIKKIMDDLVGHAQMALEQGDLDLRDCLISMQRLEQCAASGLLDEKDRRRGREIIVQLQDKAETMHDQLQLSSLNQDDEADLMAYQALLLRRGRFTAFRALRAAVAAGAEPFKRRRPFPPARLSPREVRP